MSSQPAEERYPLLLLYVEENGKKSEFPQRVVFADKGRGKHLSKGAAAIITQWPAQVTSCWLTSIALGSSFVFLALLLLMSSLTPMMHPIRPRCARDLSGYHGNKTVFLVKQGSSWNRKQMDILKYVADTYPDFEIQNIIIENSLKMFQNPEPKPTPPSKRNNHSSLAEIPLITKSLFAKLNDFLLHSSKEENSKRLVHPIKKDHVKYHSNDTNSTLLRRIKRNSKFLQITKTYEDILSTYENIKERKTTLKIYFMNTPLRYFWMDLNPEMVIFAIRVHELWQNGGISFHIPPDEPNSQEEEPRINKSTNENETDSNKTKKDSSTTNSTRDLSDKFDDSAESMLRLKMLITNTKLQYDKIQEDIVSVDGQGMHMVTRTPCHTFFGEMLMRMQRGAEEVSVTGFIQKVLNSFCGRGAVDSEYCKKLKRK